MDPFMDTNIVVNRLVEEWKQHGKIIVAYDFDNTVFDYHQKGYEFSDVISLLQKLRDDAHFIVFTSCEDEKFEEIRNYLNKMNIPYDTINENMNFVPFNGRKVYYNILLDDRAGLRSAYETLNLAYNKFKEETRLEMNKEEYKKEVDILLSMISDAHKRMATNRDVNYRSIQQRKIDVWQEELTTLHEKSMAFWIQIQ